VTDAVPADEPRVTRGRDPWRGRLRLPPRRRKRRTPRDRPTAALAGVLPSRAHHRVEAWRTS